MALRDLFTRKPPPRADVTPPPAAPIPLARAPAYQPLSIVATDPVDAEVLRLWALFQSRHPHRTTPWTDFLDELRAHNAEISERLKSSANSLSHYQGVELFKP